MENIFTAAQPFYLLSKVMGLFPMSFEGPIEKGNFKVKWHDVIYSLFSLTVPISLIAFNLLAEVTQVSSSALLSDIWVIHSITGVSLLILQFSYQVCKRKEILRFLEAVNEFDEKVGGRENNKHFG